MWMRWKILCPSLTVILLAYTAGGAAAAGKTFCVDGGKEWTEQKDLDKTKWSEKGNDVIHTFYFQPEGWPERIPLGLFWTIPLGTGAFAGLSSTTEGELKKLQYLKADFAPATEESTAIVRFNRTVPVLTDAGEIKPNLAQTWRYKLQFSDDCKVLSGTVTMFQEGKTKEEDGLSGPVVLVRK
jgi:hypothetical protein